MRPIKEKGDRRVRFEFDSRGIIRHWDRYSGIMEYQIEVREENGVKSFSLLPLENCYVSGNGNGKVF